MKCNAQVIGGRYDWNWSRGSTEFTQNSWGVWKQELKRQTVLCCKVNKNIPRLFVGVSVTVQVAVTSVQAKNEIQTVCIKNTSA